MTESKVWDGKKGLIVGLVILLIVIVGLVIGILVTMNLGRGNEGNSIVSKCMLGNFDETATCIEKVYIENGDINEFIDMYGVAINNAKKSDEYGFASRLVVQYITSLVNYGYCNRAMDVLDGEDFREYNSEDLVYVYSRAASISLECDNNEEREKWINLMMDAQGELEYEAF